MKFPHIATFLAASIAIVGCGGGGGSSPMPTSPAAPRVPVAAAPSTAKSATACVPGARCITIVVPKSSAATKGLRTKSQSKSQSVRPLYISPSTASALITVATATGSRSDGLLDGTPLSGYPISATISPTSPGCGVDSNGATTCSVALPGIANNGAGYGVAVALFDASNYPLGTSVISPTTATIDGGGNPLAYAPLDFGTVVAGANNYAHAVVSGIVANVHVVQPSAFAELTAKTLTMSVLPADADGNAFTGNTRYVDANGIIASVALFVHRTSNIGPLGDVPVANVYSVAYACPTGDPNGSGTQMSLLDPSCSVSLAYNGTTLALPSAYAATAGITVADDATAVNVLVNTDGNGNSVSVGTFWPLAKPAATLQSPTSLAFDVSASSPQSISYGDLGFGLKNLSSNNTGHPGFFSSNNCGPNNFSSPPTPQYASVNVIDEATTSVTASSPGSCVVGAVLYEQEEGSFYQAVERESEQIPVSVGGAIPVSTAVEVTPSVASFASSSSGTSMRLSQYADPAAGAFTYGVSVGFCLTNDTTFAVGGQSGLASNSVANALSVAPSSFNLTGTLGQDLALAQSGGGDIMCEIDVSPDFGPGGQPSNGRPNTGAKYYAVSTF